MSGFVGSDGDALAGGLNPSGVAQALTVDAQGRLITVAQGVAAGLLGTVFSASIGQQAIGAAAYAGMSIFNNATAKNIIIVSFQLMNDSANNNARLFLTSGADPAFGTALTPANHLAGGAASAIAATCSYALASLVPPGGLPVGVQFPSTNSGTNMSELIVKDYPIILPAGVAKGVAAYINGATGNTITGNVTWIEL